uniref:Uncharacterized protein n=1 Tax=Romanomermis culicivorax TaxID=13658 RepID=A0A915HXU7_ROMCU
MNEIFLKAESCVTDLLEGATNEAAVPVFKDPNKDDVVATDEVVDVDDDGLETLVDEDAADEAAVEALPSFFLCFFFFFLCFFLCFFFESAFKSPPACTSAKKVSDPSKSTEKFGEKYPPSAKHFRLLDFEKVDSASAIRIRIPQLDNIRHPHPCADFAD